MPLSGTMARWRADRTGNGLGRAWVRWLRRGVTAALVLYSVTTVPGVRWSGGYNVALDGWLQNGVLVGAALLIFVRVRIERSDRFAWASIGTGVALYALGNALYAFYVQYLDPISYPSVADLPWLGSYLFLYLGLVSLVRRRVHVADRTLWLDGLVAVLGVGAIATIWLYDLERTTVGPVSTVVTTMAYPVSDVLLFMIILAATGLLGWRPDRVWTYLGVGAALFAAADTVYVFRVATETYQAGTMLDPVWAIAALLFASAALRRPAERTGVRTYGWAVLVVPSLFTLSSVGLLAFGSVRRLPLVAIVLATSAVVAGLTRAAITFHEVQQLAVTRIEARTDELTGLGNRRRFLEVVEARIDQLEPGERVAVLLLDLDRFKEVNDSLGHSVGDTLLIDVGRRLSRSLRRDDLLARLAGDEFAIMLGPASSGASMQAAERLRQELQRPFTVDDIVIFVDASVGIALCPDVATTVEGLLQRADIAMYAAKTDRLGSSLYEAGDDDDLVARMRLIQELRSAIGDGQLVLHFQPKVNLRTGAIVGAEAVVRWNHPERGLLYPDSFIPAAERYGVIRALTTAVMMMALDQARAWQRMGFPIPVAVNVSASNLLDTELPDQVAAMLKVRALLPGSLTLEVTETNLMLDPTRAVGVLRRLNEVGICISVDDYGTGYSSLARLRDMPVSELKLDRSFLAELGSDSRAAEIVKSTIALAHALGLTLVAEGIETAETRRLLTELDCDLGQGYLLGRPMPAAELTSRLRTSSATAGTHQ